MSLSSLAGKVAIITGASRGIGAACAREFAKNGTSLLLHGRDGRALEQVAEECEALNNHESDLPKVARVLGDLQDPSTCTAIVSKTREAFGCLDILFNNASFKHPQDDGIHLGGSVEAMDAMYKVIIRAPYLLVQNLIPELALSKGTVINCSSTGAHVVVPRMPSYSVQKAAMNHLTKVLALSLCNKGIRVNSVNPGYVPTHLLNRVVGDEVTEYWYRKMANLTPLDRKLSSSDEVASVVMFLASDMSRAMTGQLMMVDRGAMITNPMVDWKEHE